MHVKYETVATAAALLLFAACGGGTPIGTEHENLALSYSSVLRGADLPGLDCDHYTLGPDATPETCAQKCLKETPANGCYPWCNAWTFVYPGHDGDPNPECWLKSGVSYVGDARPNHCAPPGHYDPQTTGDMVSGVMNGRGFEWGVDRPGVDTRGDQDNVTLGDCVNACAGDYYCLSYTWVSYSNGAGYGPGHCYLKGGYPTARLWLDTISGVKFINFDGKTF